jgi:hypothetical protein
MPLLFHGPRSRATLLPWAWAAYEYIHHTEVKSIFNVGLAPTHSLLFCLETLKRDSILTRLAGTAPVPLISGEMLLFRQTRLHQLKKSWRTQGESNPRRYRDRVLS